MDVPLVGRMQPESVGQADGLLVERLQLGVGEMLELCGAVQQLVIEQLPAERLASRPATSPPPAPYSREIVISLMTCPRIVEREPSPR